MRKFVNGAWVEIPAKRNKPIGGRIVSYNVADLPESDPRKAALLKQMADYQAKVVAKA